MDGRTAFDQIVAATQEVCELLKIKWDARKKRNWRQWDEGYPLGLLEHLTASNAAVTPKRPLGRIPVLFRRFARNSGSPGVHLIVWDTLMPQFEAIRAKYEVYEILRCDVFCWGLEKAFYHGNSANGWGVGVENRNLGRLKKRSDDSFGWGKGGKNDYVGREPVGVRGFYCEPYTLAQIEANIWFIRWLRDMFPIERKRVTGHENVTSNRTDPSPHFPLKMVRDLGFNDFQLESLKQLYADDDEFFNRYDEWIEDDLDDLVVDTDIDALFGREGDVCDCEFEDDEGLYGEDGEVTEKDIIEVKKALVQLGYWPMADNESLLTDKITAEYEWSLKLFQKRWVKRKGKRWISTLKDTGKADWPTTQKLNQMLRQWNFID